MIIYKPYSPDKTIGVEYNKALQMSKEAGHEWAILMDIDTCFLTPTQPRLITKAIEEAKAHKVGMFVCKTNRVGYKQHLLNGKRDPNPSITDQIEIAKAIEATPFNLSTAHHQVSGFFMCVNVKAWEEIGGFKEEGLLGVDDDYSTRLSLAGYKILMINNLYVWHTYRLGSHAGDTTHLK